MFIKFNQNTHLNNIVVAIFVLIFSIQCDSRINHQSNPKIKLFQYFYEKGILPPLMKSDEFISKNIY